MRLVFLSTPPSFSVVVTFRYLPVPPNRQASSAGSPHRQAAASGSLFSLSNSARAGTGLAARAPAASAAPPAIAAAASAASLTKRRGSCKILAWEEQKKQKKARDNYRDNSRHNPVRTR